MRINRHSFNAHLLTQGRIIFPHNRTDCAYIIRRRNIVLDADGKQSEMWDIYAESIKSWLVDRIVLPPPNRTHDAITAPAESVLYHYANTQAIAPRDAGNKVTNLIAGDNLARGQTIAWESRFQTLADTLNAVGFQSGFGWTIDVDLHARKYVFKALQGRNLSAGQTDLPPATFSPTFKTLASMSYTESDLDFKNYAVVAGQGEGMERRVVTVGSAAGTDRRVLFVDARDISEVSEGDNPQPLPVSVIEEKLRERGRQKLAEHAQQVYVEGSALPVSRLKYRVDYDLGDVVSIQNREWGIAFDEQITEITEIYEPGKYVIDLKFGVDEPTIYDSIDEDLSTVKGMTRT